MGKACLAVRRVLGNTGETAVHPIPRRTGRDLRMAAEQIAGDVGGIRAVSGKRTAIAAAGGHFHLGDFPVRKDGYRLQTALTAEVGTVGVAVVKNVPLPVDLLQSAVVIAAIKHRLVCGLVGVNMHIGIADDHAAIGKRPQRGIADGIAQLMVIDGGIDKIVPLPNLPD